ncbi:hypothetical protein F5Y16DRAFT_386972 [Xylariaceae sp. FL0255]|nr:hypothetical protein F5Y16DRAFT_386972 [Xylariaceae sp. FL0255]
MTTIRPFVINGEATFAIRGAGQQPFPGCADNQGGINVDLRLFRGINLDLENRIVAIAAGERWGTTYKKLQPHGRSITGSRSDKGVIGEHALAGIILTTYILTPHTSLEAANNPVCYLRGLPFFSSQEARICDDVAAYETALASFAIVNCSAVEQDGLDGEIRWGASRHLVSLIPCNKSLSLGVKSLAKAVQFIITPPKHPW